MKRLPKVQLFFSAKETIATLVKYKRNICVKSLDSPWNRDKQERRNGLFSCLIWNRKTKQKTRTSDLEENNTDVSTKQAFNVVLFVSDEHAHLIKGYYHNRPFRYSFITVFKSQPCIIDWKGTEVHLTLSLLFHLPSWAWKQQKDWKKYIRIRLNYKW